MTEVRHRGYTRAAEMGRGARLASKRVGYVDASVEQYRGGDIIRWLRAEEQRHMQMQAEGAGDAEEERLEPRWVLEFDAKSHGGEAMTRMEECWLLCRRMLQVGLSISHYARKHGATLIITVGANTHALRTEAARIKLPMRMQDTMGMIPFTEQPIKNALMALILDTLKHHRVDEAKIQAVQADCAVLGTAELARKAREVGCEHIEVSLPLPPSHSLPPPPHARSRTGPRGAAWQRSLRAHSERHTVQLGPGAAAGDVAHQQRPAHPAGGSLSLALSLSRSLARSLVLSPS